jgi:hypothetical protein
MGVVAPGRVHMLVNCLGEFIRRVEPEADDSDRRRVVANIVRRIQVPYLCLTFVCG